MKQEKIKPNSQDLKNKAIVTARLLHSSVDYDSDKLVFHVYEVYRINGETYSHHDVMPLTKEQIDKLSIDIPAAVVSAKFEKIETCKSNS